MFKKTKYIISEVLVFSSLAVLLPVTSEANENENSHANGLHAEDNIRVVRELNRKFRKELIPNGIRMTSSLDEKQIDERSYLLSEFQDSKRFCNEGKGELLVGHLHLQAAKVVQACKDAGFEVERSHTDGPLIACSYDCSKVTLKQIQQVFFSPSVTYLHPNARRGLSEK